MTITPEIIAALGSAIVAIFAGFYGFAKWVIKTFLSELKPNGGSSLKDQVNALNAQLDRLEARVDTIVEILMQPNTKGRKKKNEEHLL